ncbi:hypothetical protein QQ045_028838 [Rhodiola kirilowii]
MQIETHSLSPIPSYSIDALHFNLECCPTTPHDYLTPSRVDAAVTVQKVYRSYRTRRRLADSAVVAEEMWWQAIDFAKLNHTTVSFFSFSKPETAASRLKRVTLNASKVGKGLSQDDKAQKLAFQHWIEAIDPRHRYGHSLHKYYEEWCKSDGGQPFFYWLDIGDGKDVDLKDCPRSVLRKQCIKYLGPQERDHYEYNVADGKIVHLQTGELLDTNKGGKDKWIFVMSTSKKLYAGVKKKGKFHHSSFLAGGTTLAAGRLVVDHGILKVQTYFVICSTQKTRIFKCLFCAQVIFVTVVAQNAYHVGVTFFATLLWVIRMLNFVQISANFISALNFQSISAYSGHYRPTDESLDIFMSYLSESGVNLKEVQIHSSKEDDDSYSDTKLDKQSSEEFPVLNSLPSEIQKPDSTSSFQQVEVEGTRSEYKRTLSGGLQSTKANVPQKSILKRLNSKKEAKSYQLGHQLSMIWTSGLGPRIGCVGDYPVELRLSALEFTDLSPRGYSGTPPNYRRLVGLASPKSNRPDDEVTSTT